MIQEEKLIQEDILAYLHQHENKELLRFITCGSVDDGKSTLIGRLLHDSKMIFEDHMAAIEKDSKKVGTTGEKVDLALLVDGLQSEREQGITIDVAYRYFTTDKRKFIIADTPGHEQYTRNMATGASTADLAVILIDARYGVQVQTRRHSFIALLLGIKHIVVAINKMDLVEFSEEKFEQIKDEYQALASSLNLQDIYFVPMSALEGDNVVSRSQHTDWYKGKTLMELLETIDISHDTNMTEFRMPVQYVSRPNLDYRGFAGTIASGKVSVGDEIVTLPSGKSSKVKSIDTFDGQLETAHELQAVTITLEDEIDSSRGDMLVHKGASISQSSRALANIVWMSEKELTPHGEYYIKFATKFTTGSISDIKHKINVNTLAHEEAPALALNEIAECEVQLNEAVTFDVYNNNRQTGAFIIIDRITNVTVGAGMVKQALESSAKDKSSYSQQELELNAFVRKHYPHWGARDISKA
jgi:sulfate adenylyltransferase subunit 1